MMTQGKPIEELKGIGDKTGKLFRRLGIETVEDLLHYYPRAYDPMEAPVSIGELKENEPGAVRTVLAKPADLLRFNGLQLVSVPVKDLTGSLQLTWYNMPYMRSHLKTGMPYVFRGRVVRRRGRLTMEQPEVFSEEDYGRLVSSMQPIYGQTRGLGNKAIAKAVSQALALRRLEREYLPEDIRRRYELAEYNFAIEHIHYPKDRQDLLFARKRLVFDEFFFFLAAVGRLKEKREDLKSDFPMKEVPEPEILLSSLPYQLTKAQMRTWKEVSSDMCSGRAMNRLVQGDVGSGKTVVAVLALLLAAGNGFQGALMVPTEVLARQHYESIVKLLSDCGLPQKAILLTGSMTAKEKREACRMAENHEADIIVGTHALIQEKVSYDRLALVITDEQHRFGVGQREALGKKSGGAAPHVLVMSATPIPRTLAIILYGDLDISQIDELPANRLPIKNCVVGKDYRENAYRFIAGQAAQGRQAYVLCPMVEDSEMSDAENVLDYTKLLKENLPGLRIEFLHGRMKPKEKNKIMEAFAAGTIDVLVSTTVVEVGVNVPNATVMMIENAERFGLAQLHQLRGRVGRGKAQSYCIMVDASGDPEKNERLQVLNQSNDGFFIASEDLRLRGPGDIFGLRQSGEQEFKLADIFTDAGLLKQVSEDADRLLSEDPELEQEENRELKKRLEEYLKTSYEKLSL